MATFSTYLRQSLQAVGENTDTWGTVLNTNFQLLEQSIAALVSVDATTGSDITLTTNNGSEDEARKAILWVEGTPTSTVGLEIPSLSKLYVVESRVSGSNNVLIRTDPSNTAVTLTPNTNRTLLVMCDGTNVFEVAAKRHELFQKPTDGHMIMFWSGSVGSVPKGWQLCDGTNGTPNLSEMFIKCAVSNGPLGSTGGNLSVTVSVTSHSHGAATSVYTLTSADLPPHTHFLIANNATGLSGDTPTSTNYLLRHRQGGGAGDDDLYNLRAQSSVPNLMRTSEKFGDAPGSVGDGSAQGHSHNINADGAQNITVSVEPPYFVLAPIAYVGV